MILGEFFKWPDDRLDYVIDCALWLEKEDAIQNIALSIEKSAPEYAREDKTPLMIDDYEFDGNIIKIWLKGGTPYIRYYVNCLIATNNGLKKQVSFMIIMRPAHSHDAS